MQAWQFSAASALKLKSGTVPLRDYRPGLRTRLSLPGAALAVLLLALLCSPSVQGDTSLTLGWREDTSLGIAGYRVSYGTASRQYTNTVETELQFSCTITGLVDDTTYYFAVKAFDSLGNESGYSEEVSYPSQIPVQARIYPDGATLTWNETMPANVVGYNVYYGTSSGAYTNSVQTELGVVNGQSGYVCTLSNLLPATTYYFAVSAYDTTGTASEFSPEQTYTTMAQLLSAVSPTLQFSLALDGNVQLSATGCVGQAYAVLATESLAPAAWIALQTICPDGSGLLSFTDAATTNRPARFYRLQAVSSAPAP